MSPPRCRPDALLGFTPSRDLTLSGAASISRRLLSRAFPHWPSAVVSHPGSPTRRLLRVSASGEHGLPLSRAAVPLGILGLQLRKRLLGWPGSHPLARHQRRTRSPLQRTEVRAGGAYRVTAETPSSHEVRLPLSVLYPVAVARYWFGAPSTLFGRLSPPRTLRYFDVRVALRVHEGVIRSQAFRLFRALRSSAPG